MFPNHTQPIVQIACGADHAIALTCQNEIFSWGNPKYGCLGFGDSIKPQLKPTKLEIKDHKFEVLKIIQIACGKYHSIVLTERNSVFTWGRGLNCQLGQGPKEEDEFKPVEIYYLSQRKPIFIAAGENHGAAISEKNQLYTWGNGGYGRLGHESEAKVGTPQLVETLKQHDIVYVSCGSFHTLCIDNKGGIWSFGQNKYGKLGIYSTNNRDGNAQKLPKKISMFVRGRDDSS